MAGIMYGYARVSTQAQNEARQLDALRAFGVMEEHIIVEKQSGKNFDRPLYRQMVTELQPKDILVIQSIDRLGRNYTDILEQWQAITKEHKAAIVVLDMPLLDTREGRDLTGMLIADIVLQILSYVAQKERESIRQRQAEGIAAARARGVHLGRRPKAVPEAFKDFAEQWSSGGISSREAALQLGISHTNFLAKAKEYCGSLEN